MGVKGKLELEVDIKSSGDVFHELIAANPHNVSKIFDKVHGCSLHEGDGFGKVGSVLEWDYTHDGKRRTAKEVIEAIDEENRTVRKKIIGGDFLDEYKSFTISIHVIPKGDIDVVMWVLEFERVDDIGSYPTDFMNHLISLTRDVEAHHVTNA